MKKELAILGLVFMVFSTSFAKDEDESKQISDVVQPFLKAMKDKNIDAAIKHASTPWLTGDEKIIKERDELKKHLQEQMKKFDAKRWSGEVQSVLGSRGIARQDAGGSRSAVGDDH